MIIYLTMSLQMLRTKMEDVIDEDAEWTADTQPRPSTSHEHRESGLLQHYDHAHHHYEHGLHHFHPRKQSSTALERKIRHNREHPPHSLPRLSVVPPTSSNSSVDNIPIAKPQRQTLSHADESMTVVLSAFYAKLLIILGVAFPVTSTIQNELYTNITSDVFAMYLYLVSMSFLAYIFYHLRIAKKDKNEVEKRTSYGSFYLHMGVAGFGVGSIIYSCLQFGEYFDLSGDCRMAIVAVKPALRILFMVAQTVFIFSYTDKLDRMRGVILDRFGLMHLIATNVCEWFNVVIQETRDDIVAVAYERPTLLRYANITAGYKTIISDESDNATFIETQSTTPGLNDNITIDLNWSCNVSDIVTPLIRSVNPYLRNCGVEYSLLCSVILVVIWNDLCTVPGLRSVKKVAHSLNKDAKQCCERVKYSKHFSVDCGSAHKGLFAGVATLAGTVVSLMLFNGLFQNGKHEELALLQINIWETVLFIVMTLGSGACLQRMRRLPLRRTVPSLPLEHSLLLVTQFGVYLYYLFQIIGAGFVIQRYPEGRRATRILSPLCAIVQSSCQTLLILDSWCRRCVETTISHRPGRQLVTFLLVGNFALWLLNRVKNARAEFHPLQMEFFGVWAWTLITHVSVPLLVCYRFQATVCFYEIWKNCFKRKKYGNEINVDEFELKNHHIA
ncbi:proton channel OtopLc-like isoform X2 [Plodia interpunctella]|uniref:proton channel OtopLc-like isoform X2 n=1 Tax=Plodia interpunctella TaxID=58824 RepID=UPI0023687C9E|nr:proton channel OtopLc-like isoform X2 [Plodia interpunctella]